MYNHETGWARIPDPLEPYYAHADHIVDQAATLAGYSPAEDYGDTCQAGRVQLAANPDHDTYPYLVTVEPTLDYAQMVFLPDLPSLLALVREVAPLHTLGLAHHLRTLVDVAFPKLFHTWHGHDWRGVCPDCDPFTYQLLEIQRAAMQQAPRDETSDSHDRLDDAAEA